MVGIDLSLLWLVDALLGRWSILLVGNECVGHTKEIVTEAQHTAKWIREMRKKHPEWTIIKFNDRLTKGIPDLAICNGARTLWIECKRWDTPRPKLQQFFLSKLGGYYLTFDKLGRDWFYSANGSIILKSVEELMLI